MNGLSTIIFKYAKVYPKRVKICINSTIIVCDDMLYNTFASG